MNHSEKCNALIKRDDIMALEKCESEGSPSEQKICLGWVINSPQTLVKFTFHKFIACLSQGNKVMIINVVCFKQLQ